ncbi:hypothetical protein A6770_05645 [Nostoc minutum NIES-26]|uniref:Uncharacterized protein n=1 Tax=Nostoc minutum NIES-26 TaxID=1844469 RepID=A0A367Q6D3_9NOSO|nr:hypothetical protein A6770_05645 [Nostoc minutum NIES-26]
MSNILIKDLNVPGSYLFSGEESYLNEINDKELNFNSGGISPIIGAFVLSYSASYYARQIHDKNKGIIAWL